MYLKITVWLWQQVRNKGINMKFSMLKYKIKQSQVYGSVLLCLFSNMYITQAQAERDVTGWWRTEQQSVVEASFGTITLKTGQNVAGQAFPANASADINNQEFYTHCRPGTSLKGDRATVYTDALYPSPVVLTKDGWNYIQANDYFLAAMKFTANRTQHRALPFNRANIGNTTEQCGDTQRHGGKTSYEIQLIIRKPFIGYNYFRIPIAKIYTGDGAGTAIAEGAGQEVILSGTVLVPESCQINVANNITIDFGKISKNAFVQAGAGNKPAGVNEKTEQLAIKCDNLANTSALLTLRLITKNAMGDTMISSDPAIGFKVANAADGKILVPNDSTSKIPFQYVSPNPTNIALKFWPVSVTGLPPTLGKFNAEGYLRVDYN